MNAPIPVFIVRRRILRPALAGLLKLAVVVGALWIVLTISEYRTTPPASPMSTSQTEGTP